jgi:hypothetical protein
VESGDNPEGTEELPHLIAATLEPLPFEVLGWALARRLDAMLERLNAYDFLGAVALSESLLNEQPDHGLAAVCQAEALAVLRSFLEGPLKVTRTDAAVLGEEARAFLAGAEGKTPKDLLPPSGVDRLRGLWALHELVRLGFFEVRDNTFVEPKDSVPPAPRIEERANTAAVEELDKAIALYPGERFGIGRCDEMDFGELWNLPTHQGCKEIFPVAIGAPDDVKRREAYLLTCARATHGERCTEMGSQESGKATTQVLYVVIAPP